MKRSLENLSSSTSSCRTETTLTRLLNGVPDVEAYVGLNGASGARGTIASGSSDDGAGSGEILIEAVGESGGTGQYLQ